MLPTDWSKVDKDAIDRLVANAVPEGVSLEYKEQLATSNDSQKKEFLADVSSFANASGGDLVFGISEARDASGQPTNFPQAAEGVALVEADLTRLDSIVMNGIAPRPSLQMKLVPGFAQGPVLVIRVPRSWSGPHMVTYQHSSRFYSRSSAGKIQLDVHQIRAAFAQSEALPERIRGMRLERLGRIIAGDAPGQIGDKSALILHLIPYVAFSTGFAVDLGSIRQGSRLQPPNPYGGWDTRFTIDALVAKGTAPGYTQLFRNGVIELVETPVSFGKQGVAQFPPEQVERLVVDRLPALRDLLLSLGVTPPLAVLLTIVNVRGHHGALSAGRHMAHHRDHAIDRNELLLPEIVLESGRENLVTALRPVFDALWQSCNFDRNRSGVGLST